MAKYQPCLQPIYREILVAIENPTNFWVNANIGYLVTVWNTKEMKELVQNTCSMYSRCLDASKAATSSLVGSES